MQLNTEYVIHNTTLGTSCRINRFHIRGIVYFYHFSLFLVRKLKGTPKKNPTKKTTKQAPPMLSLISDFSCKNNVFTLKD